MSVLIGIGAFCLAAIEHPLDIAALGALGAFCITLAVSLGIWAIDI